LENKTEYKGHGLKNFRRVCVFAHYDKHNKVDDYVYYYLTELLTVVQKLVFVTVSNIGDEDIARLNTLNIEVIKRKNIGYDFYSYKVGIDSIKLQEYNELIICNDSVFGPTTSLKKIFEKQQEIISDFWGMSDSGLISYHLQSYFLVFKKPVLQAKIFTNFWDEMKILHDKNEIITKYEVGLSLLLSEKFVSHSLVNKVPLIELYKGYLINIRHKKFILLRLLKTILTFRLIRLKTKKQYNAPISTWEYLVLEHQLPFIKKSLFTTDANKMYNLKKLQQMEKYILPYPILLIQNFIKKAHRK